MHLKVKSNHKIWYIWSVCALSVGAGHPVNTLDEQNWDQLSAGAPCAYTGLLYYHRRSMQSGTEYLFRDHLSKSPQCTVLNTRRCAERRMFEARGLKQLE